MKLDRQLLEKYDIPAPRYTSYPTVPYWDNSPTPEEWVQELGQSFAQKNMRWSLYVHIPYCETLCTFCGCSVAITKDHSKEVPYVESLLKEWGNYLQAVPKISEHPLTELHLGGGTPTFLSPQSLEKLLRPILAQSQSKDTEMSIEVDPRRTTQEHLEVLYKLGFRRISLGVQDFEPEVQRIVHRVQSRELVETMTKSARLIGYSSVNYDLIYGLPKQTPESIKRLAEITVELKPDRIALYSFAKVPWIKPAQRLFTDADLPEGADKRLLYEIAREILENNSYVEIGMDHFALKSDGLYKAQVDGSIHRNFMGYTDRRTQVLLGLGVSAISDSPHCFHQNDKDVTSYMKRVNEGQIPTFRGHKLTEEDRVAREQILHLMTAFETDLEATQAARLQDLLATMIADKLVDLTPQKLRITEKGRPFLRNACMALDRRLLNKAPQTRIFSQAL